MLHSTSDLSSLQLYCSATQFDVQYFSLMIFPFIFLFVSMPINCSFCLFCWLCFNLFICGLCAAWDAVVVFTSDYLRLRKFVSSMFEKSGKENMRSIHRCDLLSFPFSWIMIFTVKCISIFFYSHSHSLSSYTVVILYLLKEKNSLSHSLYVFFDCLISGYNFRYKFFIFDTNQFFFLTSANHLAKIRMIRK